MLDFVARVFRGFINVLLWLILLGCAIGGAIFGGTSGGFGFGILGLILGALFGLIITILSGGLIANFLNIVDNIEIIAYNKSTRTSSGGSSSDKSSSGANQNPIPIAKPVYGDTWTCKKCNEENPITSSTCKGCGAYK